MEDSIPLAEVEKRLAALVDEAANGREILIERDGVPVARLAPLRAKMPRQPSELWTVTRIDDEFDAADVDVERLLEGED